MVTIISKDKITNIILASIFILLILLSFLVFIYGITFTSVSTDSMSPTYQGYDRTNTTVDIFNGDMVILQHKAPQIGDVILFRDPITNGVYFHRVIAMGVFHNQTYFLTKGDGNRYSDNSHIGDTYFGWIPEENVIGVAIFTIHWIGWLVDQIFTIDFLLPLLGLILLGYVIYYSFKEDITKKLASLRRKAKTKKILRLKHITLSFHKGYLRLVLVLILIIGLAGTFFAVEFFNAQEYQTSVALLQTDGSTLPNYINLANPHLFDLETIQYNSTSAYFLDIKLQLTSGGLFNSLNSVTLRLLSNQTSLNKINEQMYYKWVTAGEFAGTKIINGGLVIPFNLVTGINSTVQINIEFTISHVFYQTQQIRTQSIIFG